MKFSVMRRQTKFHMSSYSYPAVNVIRRTTERFSSY